MSWQISQVATIIMEYAHNGVAYCPIDNIPLDTLVEHLPGTRNVILIHRCPSCGNDTRTTVQSPVLSSLSPLASR